MADPGDRSDLHDPGTTPMAIALPPDEGRRRAVVENVRPCLEAGRFPIKRVVGERVTVEADIFADGHDSLAAVLQYRQAGEEAWSEVPLQPLGNDRWRGEFVVSALGRCRYRLVAWVDRFASWRADLEKRVAAGQVTPVDLQIGAGLIREAAGRARGADRASLLAWAAALEPAPGQGEAEQAARALSPELADLVSRYPDRRFATFSPELEVVVDREKARFSTWYELFPRSASPDPGRHGTLRDVETRLPYIASMGFDVLYLPPIHPIGLTHRKGPNNTPVAGPGDPGSPWAIGSAEGGHTAVHPQLGTLEDFDRLVRRAAEYGIEIALDLAFQCSPDHPYVREHPEWFRIRPDGTIQYAENPPKKYQDIVPFDFESDHWQALWEELLGVVLFWVRRGVRIFRVDNPHTKPFPFWEWLIREVKARQPEVIFLSEAFTRPRVMERLAKLGFSQSYTYFAWRNTSWELMEYFNELTRTERREYFRPNLWPNTPDILTEYLQAGGRPAFMARLVLAATLSASYGIYGPAFELCENRAAAPGSEEYRDSEKYQLRTWDLEAPHSLRELIARVNRIRRENPALQRNDTLAFHPVDNEWLLAYTKQAPEDNNLILVVVNLDPFHVHSGWVTLPLEDLGLDPGQPYQVHDLLTDARYLWNGPRNFVLLDPAQVPAHIFRVRRRLRREGDFEYYQ